MVGERRQRLSKLRRSGLAAVQPSACPSGLQRSPSCKERKRIRLAEFDDNFYVAPGSFSITANYLEVGFEDINVDQGRYMTGFDRVGTASSMSARAGPTSPSCHLVRARRPLATAPVSGPKRDLASRSRSGS